MSGILALPRIAKVPSLAHWKPSPSGDPGATVKPMRVALASPMIHPVAPESAKVNSRTLPDRPLNSISGASVLSAAIASPLMRTCAELVPPCTCCRGSFLLFPRAGRLTGAGFTVGICQDLRNFFSQKHSAHRPFASVLGLRPSTSWLIAGFWTRSPACGECLPGNRSSTSLVGKSSGLGAEVACDPRLQG